MSRCAYHCAACGGHFASLEAFDLHRFGPWGDRRCLDPDEESRLVVAGRGLCGVYRITIPGAVVWTATRSVGRAAEAFGTRPERLAESGRAAETVGPDIDLPKRRPA